MQNPAPRLPRPSQRFDLRIIEQQFDRQQLVAIREVRQGLNQQTSRLIGRLAHLENNLAHAAADSERERIEEDVRVTQIAIRELARLRRLCGR